METRRLGMTGAALVLSALVIGLLGGAWLANRPAAQVYANAPAAATTTPGAWGPGWMHAEGTPGPGGMMGGGQMDADNCPMVGTGAGYNDTSLPYDQRFLAAMIPHHQMAVVSAQQMIANSSRPEMRDLANRIITGQQREIDQMQGWLAAWYPGTTLDNTGAGMSSMMSGGPGYMNGRAGSMMGGMMGGMMGNRGDLDRMFVQMMIPHHEAAIRMAQDALQQATHPEIKTLAQAIIATQQAEITEMRTYLRDWYGITTP